MGGGWDGGGSARWGSLDGGRVGLGLKVKESGILLEELGRWGTWDDLGAVDELRHNLSSSPPYKI